jgi:hypothetical protein
MNQQLRNQIKISEPQKKPDNDNIVAQFLGGLGAVGQGIGQAVGQVGTGIASGIEQGVGLIGQGVSEMNKSPEGRLALRELVGAALRNVGQEDLGVGLQQYAKRVYQPEAQRALYETQQRAETKKAERKAVADLQGKGFQQISPQKQKNIPQQYVTQVSVGDKKVSLVNQKALKEDLKITKKEWLAAQRAKKQYDLMISSIDKLISPLEKGTNVYQTTNLGKRISIQEGFGEEQLEMAQRFIRSGKSVDAMNYLDAITGTGAIKELQEIRQSSPTGGAVGNVSDADIELLKGAASAIREGMTDAEFVDRLSKLREQLVVSRSNLPTSKDQILDRLSGVGYDETSGVGGYQLDFVRSQ